MSPIHLDTGLQYNWIQVSNIPGYKSQIYLGTSLQYTWIQISNIPGYKSPLYLDTRLQYTWIQISSIPGYKSPIYLDTGLQYKYKSNAMSNKSCLYILIQEFEEHKRFPGLISCILISVPRPGLVFQYLAL